MSYGMMIAVQLDKKAEFDALWNWSMTHMYQKDPKHPSYGYFSWQMEYDGTVMDELPAPDGEEYYAMALFFAAHRWGNGKGIYDYQAHADRLLHDMVHREPITGPVRQRGGLHPHTVGKEVNDEHGMILLLARRAEHLHRRLVPPARVLRAVGAVGAGGGPRVLGAGGER